MTSQNCKKSTLIQRFEKMKTKNPINIHQVLPINIEICKYNYSQ